MWWLNHLALVSGKLVLQKALNHGFQKQQKTNLLSQKNEEQDLLRIKNQENWARPKNPVPDQKSSFFGSKFSDQITSRQTWSIKKRRFHSKTRSAKLCKKMFQVALIENRSKRQKNRNTFEKQWVQYKLVNLKSNTYTLSNRVSQKLRFFPKQSGKFSLVGFSISVSHLKGKKAGTFKNNGFINLLPWNVISS